MANMEKQMQMFEEGGLKQEGGSIDPISGNEVPFGSLQEEVRDDIDAKLSEGEFVFPADVVRFIGLENLMKLRQKAKKGLAEMEDMGQMGNSDEATMDDDGEFDAEINQMIDEFDPNAPDEMEFAPGGYVPGQSGYTPTPPVGINPPPAASRAPTAKQLLGTPTGTAVPAMTSKQYIGPSGDIVTITFINGVPVQPIPDGYQPYTGQVVAPQVTAPQVQVGDTGSEGRDPEQVKEEQQRQADFKMTADVLARNNPKFAEKWAQDPFNTGKISGWTDVFKSIDTALSMTDAIEQIAKEQNIDLGLYENTGFARLGGKYDSVSFAKSLALDEEDLYRGQLNEGRAERDAKAAQVREDFRAREEEEEAAFRAARQEKATGTSADRDDGRSDYDREVDRDSGQERDDGSFGDDEGNTGYGGAGDFGMAKGGLAAPKTSRKPKAKQTNTRGRGLARKK